MSACKCGLSKIYPVCDYAHFKITRNEILRQKVLDVVADHLGEPRTNIDGQQSAEEYDGS
jgi:hypothetical protein